GIGVVASGRCHNVVHIDLHRRALQCRGGEIGVAAMAEIKRAESELMGPTATCRDEVELNIVLLEPAELSRDVLRPLWRTVRNHSSNDLSLRLRGASGECRRGIQSQVEAQCAA